MYKEIDKTYKRIIKHIKAERLVTYRMGYYYNENNNIDKNDNLF